MGIVWIKVGISVPVVCAVSTGPPLDRPLHSARASSSQEVLQRFGRVIGAMGPQAVVASSDTYKKKTVVSRGNGQCVRPFVYL
jgi:hypothetical protein